MNKYTRLFIQESRVYIPQVAVILARMRAGCAEDYDASEGQRLSHSMKGMALFEELPAVAALTGSMERGFEELSGGTVDDALVTVLQTAVPLLSLMIDEVERGGATETGPDAATAAIEAALQGTPAGSGERR